MLLIRSSGISTPFLASTPVRYTTRSPVTTKYVNIQSRYLTASQPAQTIAAIPHNHRRIDLRVSWLPGICSTTTSKMKSGTPVKTCLEKNHQWGFRSSATSSPSFRRRFGYDMAESYARDAHEQCTHRARRDPRRSGRSESVLTLGVEILGDQEAPRTLGVRIASDQGVERRAVVRLDQVRQLVDEHVVEHPCRVRAEARRDAHAARLGR